MIGRLRHARWCRWHLAHDVPAHSAERSIRRHIVAGSVLVAFLGVRPRRLGLDRRKSPAR